MGRFLIPLLLSVFVAFPLQIEEKVKVQTEIVPSLYRLLIEVDTKGKSEWEVLNTLTAVDNGIKTLNIPYKGGSFKVYPLEIFDKSTKTYKVIGFKGEIRYEFLTKEPSKTAKIFYLLENIKRNYPITYRVLSENWTIPQKVIKRTKEQLREELIEKVQKLKEFYSEKLNKDCDVKEIRLEDYYNYIPYRNSPIPTPVKGEKGISLTAEVIFECY
jgi:hypothetical protein